MEVYRITHKKWSKYLYATGVAARWNSRGVEVLYCASSRSLACLENIVHRNSVELTDTFDTMVIHIPDDAPLVHLSLNELPSNWYKAGDKYYRKTRSFGDDWAAENKYLVLKVPSVIIKNEFNYLINPNHVDFDRIKLITIESFFFDIK